MKALSLNCLFTIQSGVLGRRTIEESGSKEYLPNPQYTGGSIYSLHSIITIWGYSMPHLQTPFKRVFPQMLVIFCSKNNFVMFFRNQKVLYICHWVTSSFSLFVSIFYFIPTNKKRIVHKSDT